MIKQINHQNLLTTPFVAAKAWELQNVNSNDLVLVEPSASAPLPLALDFIDYSVNPPVLNRDCNIALEQQTDDLASFDEGITGSGFFDLTDSQNADGTFKRLIHSQIREAFYNSNNNPFQVFGMEYIDFPLSKTIRNISNLFRMFTIPQSIFGDKMVEGSIQFFDTSLDDNVVITDDGYQNLVAGTNLFSKVQEVRHLDNILFGGNSTVLCPSPFPSTPISLSIASGSAILTWTPVGNNQTGFAVQKSLNGIAFNDYANVVAVSSSYTDTNVSMSNTYWYQVAAFNAIGTSSFSSTASITFAPPVPIAPSNLSASVSNSETTASLTWSDNSSDELGFIVQRSIDSGSTYFSLLTASVNATGAFDVTIASGSSYWYRVYAFNGSGTSSNSNTASIYVPFIPAGFGDMLLWLKADAIVASNDAGLSTWVDSGPLNINVTASTSTPTNQPKYQTNVINGNPAVQFGTSSFSLAPFTASSTSSAAELWVVMKTTNDPSLANQGGMVFMRSGSLGAEGIPFTDGKFYEPFYSAQADNVHIAISKPALTTTASMYNVISENNHMNISFRGELIYASDNNPVPAGGAWGALSHSIGAEAGGVLFAGHIAELIIYGRKLTMAEKDQTSIYLANKYNVTRINDTASVGPSSTQSSSLKGWWDANNITASNSSSVASVADLSGNGNHLTQSTAANKPVFFTNVYNGLPTMRFTSSAYYFGVTSPFVQGSNTPFTFMAVCKPTAANSSLLANNAANIQFRTRRVNTNENDFFPGIGELIADFPKAVGTFQLNIWTRDSGSGVVNMWQNTYKVAAGGNGGAFTWNRVADGTINTVPFIGDISEMVWWNSTLSDLEIYKLYELYFRPKWGLPGS